MHDVYINSIGKFLPGAPIDNDAMEDYLGRINGKPSKVKARILKSNGIQSRYYAIDRHQNPTHKTSQMAALAVQDALSHLDLEPGAIDLLAAATTWPDQLVPGFASMVHGALPELSALEIISSQGVCCAGVAALKYAAAQVRLGEKFAALSVASEMPSRLFKHSRFEGETAIAAGQSPNFDSEFLRWMLSDGAGAMLLQNRPNAQGLSLKIDWIELTSHANAYPVCMTAGGGDRTWMDYPNYTEAAKSGALNLRQNIRLLGDVIKLGVEGWLQLIDQGRFNPADIDWLCCHYSSHFFRSQIVELLEKAGCMVPEERWFTNLYTKGNTGCASIYLMLEELFNTDKLQPGQKICCFIPESGRFTTAYMMLTVVGNAKQNPSVLNKQQPAASKQGGLGTDNSRSNPYSIDSNHNPPIASELLRELTTVWLDFDRSLRSLPIIRKLHRGDFQIEDYQALLRNLRPQVVEGARWIARAASHMTDFRLRSTFIGHAQEEHRDFQMLERNYVSVGGSLEDITNAEKNIGSEALSAFIFHQASQDNPLDLIGSIFIIEGLGNRLAADWAKMIQTTLGLDSEQVSFLAYHGANDAEHVGKLDAMIHAEWMTEEIARRIVKTAKVTARLYCLQLEEIR
jgi:3-oxoacyl-[acyl-carrier-protein] synthase III